MTKEKKYEKYYGWTSYLMLPFLIGIIIGDYNHNDIFKWVSIVLMFLFWTINVIFLSLYHREVSKRQKLKRVE